MLQNTLPATSQELAQMLLKKNMTLATAESCTGGLIATVITDIPGASKIFERGFITYSNQSKIDLLTVPTFYIEDYGAVSMEVVIAMAEGALLMSRADISIAVTGCAGPTGGSDEKPVGTVFIGCAIKNQETTYKEFAFNGDRQSIRLQTAQAALNLAIKRLQKED